MRQNRIHFISNYVVRVFGILALVSVSFNLNAQIGYRQGYIVTNSGDTLSGWIADNGEISNAKVCKFKASRRGQSIRYSPEAIKSYRFPDGKYYTSIEVSNKHQQKKAFAEVLLKDDIALYKYWLSKEFRYYLVNENGKVIALPDEYKTVIFSDSTESVNKFEIDSYKDSLMVAFTKCSTILSDIEDLDYNSKDLIGITKEYMDCTRNGTSPDRYEKNLDISKVSFGYFGGLRLSKVFFLESDIQSNFSSSVPLGMFLTIPLPLINERIALQTELIYNRINYKSGFNNVPSIYKDISLSSSQISMPLLISYSLVKKKFSPSIGIGKELAYVFNSAAKTTPVGYDFEVPVSRAEYEYRQQGFFVHFSQRQSWFVDLGLDYKINNKFSVFSKFRLQTNLNLIIEESYYNNYMFYLAEKKNHLNNPHSNLYRTFAGNLFFGVKF